MYANGNHEYILPLRASIIIHCRAIPCVGHQMKLMNAITDLRVENREENMEGVNVNIEGNETIA